MAANKVTNNLRRRLMRKVESLAAELAETVEILHDGEPMKRYVNHDTGLVMISPYPRQVEPEEAA